LLGLVALLRVVGSVRVPGLLIRARRAALALSLGVGWLSSCGGRSAEGPREIEGVTGGNSGSGGGSSAGQGGGGGQDNGASGGTSGRGGRAGASGSGASGAGSDGGSRASGGSAQAGSAGDGGEGNEGGQGGAPAAFVPLACDPAGSWSSDLERCEPNFVHRPAAKACAPPARDPEGTVPIPRDDEDTGYDITVECTTDVDCGTGAYCLSIVDREENELHYVCRRPSCMADIDCDDGQICVCDGFVYKAASLERAAFGHCARATCVTDSDCAGGALCVAALDDDCGYGRPIAKSFQCQSAADECNADDHCGDWSYCYPFEGRFLCGECA
jgi:hypothetical protein